jgi:hypothetical protein
VQANLAKVGTNVEDDVLVDWYGTDDRDDPLNWSSGKKLFTTILIWYIISIMEI